jgi:hypothetical protein
MTDVIWPISPLVAADQSRVFVRGYNFISRNNWAALKIEEASSSETLVLTAVSMFVSHDIQGFHLS